MLAAVSASGGDCDVVVIEKNDLPGKKINITGKGRCNVTNNCTEQEYLANVVSNPKFLLKAIYRFPPAKTMEFFESNGVPLKTERGRRVFPVSDKAVDITSTLRKAVEKSGGRFVHGTVFDIEKDENGVKSVLYRTPNGVKKIDAHAVILATGGKSYPLTGSTGDGYPIAEKLGHTVTPLRPSLVPLLAEESWCKTLTGLSLKNVSVSLESGGKTVYSDQGEMLFTHFGVTGPLILAGSAYIKSFPCRMFIDMKPALSFETLDARLLSDFEEFKNKDFINSLEKLLPKAMIPVFASLSGIDVHKKTNSITKEERHRLVSLLKAIPLTITGTRPIEEAVVTAGGINVKEINPSTMESKIVPNLYFAGEIIDVDCYTGGYSLQEAFCTGYLAGDSAKQK